MTRLLFGITVLLVGTCAWSTNRTAQQAGPSVRAMNHGQFALIEALSPQPAALHTSKVRVRWTNVRSLPTQFELYHKVTDAPLIRTAKLALVPVMRNGSRWTVAIAGLKKIDVGDRIDPLRLLDPIQVWPEVMAKSGVEKTNHLLRLLDDELPLAKSAAREALLVRAPSRNSRFGDERLRARARPTGTAARRCKGRASN